MNAINTRSRIDHAAAEVARMVEESRSGKRFRGTVPWGTLLGMRDGLAVYAASRIDGIHPDEVEIAIENGVARVVATKAATYSIPVPR